MTVFGVDLKGQWREVVQYFDDIPARAAWVRTRWIRSIAAEMLKVIKANVPRGQNQEWDDYIDSLVIEQVQVRVDDSVTEVVIRSHPKKIASKLAGKPRDQTLLYIEPWERKASKLTQVLADNGPWPMSMLPAMPPKDARVRYKIVSRDEVTAIAARIKANQSSLGPLLQKAGVKGSSQLNPMWVENVRAWPDLELVGLRLEFGLPGYPMHSHWRKASTAAQRMMSQNFAKDPKLQRALTDFRNKDWKRPHEKMPLIDRSKLKLYAEFTQKVRGA